MVSRGRNLVARSRDVDGTWMGRKEGRKDGRRGKEVDDRALSAVSQFPDPRLHRESIKIHTPISPSGESPLQKERRVGEEKKKEGRPLASFLLPSLRARAHLDSLKPAIQSPKPPPGEVVPARLMEEVEKS